jgi:hypothetical protein
LAEAISDDIAHILIELDVQGTGAPHALLHLRELFAEARMCLAGLRDVIPLRPQPQPPSPLDREHPNPFGPLGPGGDCPRRVRECVSTFFPPDTLVEECRWVCER